MYPYQQPFYPQQNFTYQPPMQPIQMQMQMGVSLYPNTADSLIIKLKQAVQYYHIDVAQLFMKYDMNRQNTLDLYEFGLLLQRIDPTITANDIYTVFARFDTQRNGSICFQEFYNFFINYQIPMNYQYQYVPYVAINPQQMAYQYQQYLLQPYPFDQQQANQIINKLITAIQFYRINITQLFQSYDSNMNCTLDMVEFCQLLLKIEPHLTQNDLMLCFWKFDQDRSGSVTFYEFQSTLNNSLQQFNQYGYRPYY